MRTSQAKRTPVIAALSAPRAVTTRGVPHPAFGHPLPPSRGEGPRRDPPPPPAGRRWREAPDEGHSCHAFDHFTRALERDVERLGEVRSEEHTSELQSHSF